MSASGQATQAHVPTTEAELEQRREFLNSPTLQHNPLPSVEWELRLITDLRLERGLVAELREGLVKAIPFLPEHPHARGLGCYEACVVAAQARALVAKIEAQR